MTSSYDVIVIGGGVVGCLTARALSRYQLRILLLEREADVCSGTSKANTAIIHAGYDARPGSLKAALNVAGNRMYNHCLLYTSPSPRDRTRSRMPSSA